MGHGELLLGIDIGTSACKAAVFDRSGNALAQAAAEYPVYHPEAGAAEQDAGEWYSAACRAVRELLSGSVRNTDITAVGIDGQSWACIPVKNGRETATTPIWMDTRSAGICAELENRFGRDRLFSVCGNPMQPGYCTPKYIMMSRRMPNVMEQADAVLSSNGYIAYRLTGEMTLDASQGYGWSFFDMKKRTYDTALMDEMGIPFRQMPRICSSHEIIGRVTPTAAVETGLCAGTPVAAGGLDAACAALGAGIYRAGETQEQGGQAGGMSICEDMPSSDIRLILGCHVVP
ncbi:MAG: carbohydrate kinase, partial [Clostridia bacterium]|nr:carbohydrate kinase [Clostridia bacterium]